MDALLRRRMMMLAGEEPPTPPTPVPYDAQVEYLASDGSQYINLGIKANETKTCYYIDFEQTTNKTQARLFARNSAGSQAQIYINGSGNFAYRFGGSWREVGAGAVGTTRHTWRCDYMNMVNVVDSVSYNMTGTANTSDTNGNILLCGPYPNQNKFVGKIYSAKVWTNGVLDLDLIPVRVGTTGCFYDRVSGSLFQNAGTGNYGYGNDIT